jgi:hypothetical protein
MAVRCIRGTMPYPYCGDSSHREIILEALGEASRQCHIRGLRLAGDTSIGHKHGAFH